MGYGQVAMRAGLPGRARLTARILGQNDDPDLPWHRVLRSDGRIAMEEGSAGWREQSQRLRAEGVVVENGRVRMPTTDPAVVLDAAVWGRAEHRWRLNRPDLPVANKARCCGYDGGRSMPVPPCSRVCQPSPRPC